MHTKRRVTELLSNILSCAPEDLHRAFALTPANGVAPIDIARLAIACEEAFGLTLYDEKIAAWETVGDVCAHLDALLEEGLAEKTERTEDDRTAWFYE